jgi:hypothetical protein
MEKFARHKFPPTVICRLHCVVALADKMLDVEIRYGFEL